MPVLIEVQKFKSHRKRYAPMLPFRFYFHMFKLSHFVKLSYHNEDLQTSKANMDYAIKDSNLLRTFARFVLSLLFENEINQAIGMNFGSKTDIYGG